VKINQRRTRAPKGPLARPLRLDRPLHEAASRQLFGADPASGLRRCREPPRSVWEGFWELPETAKTLRHAVPPNFLGEFPSGVRSGGEVGAWARSGWRWGGAVRVILAGQVHRPAESAILRPVVNL
jgi:hypothetical protein